MGDMTDDERQLLDYETAHPRRTDANHETLRALGYTEARYYQKLLGLVRRPDVVAGYPQTCARVQRQTRRAAGIRLNRSAIRRNAWL